MKHVNPGGIDSALVSTLLDDLVFVYQRVLSISHKGKSLVDYTGSLPPPMSANNLSDPSSF